jgi:TetR/AcrR family transcriptional regulator, transcriptional repressor for nem operon
MDQAEETRERIIKKAAQIFNMHGFAGTSMSQLTKAVGMTKGAIYCNFKGKDELALAAFDYNFNRIKQETAQVIRAKDNACDKLIAFANFYLDQFAIMTQNGGCPILNAATDADNVHPPLKERALQAIETWTDTVARIIRKGLKYKQIKPDVRPEQFASIFVSLIEGGILLSKTSGNAIHLSRNVDHIIHLVNSQLRA